MAELSARTRSRRWTAWAASVALVSGGVLTGVTLTGVAAAPAAQAANPLVACSWIQGQEPETKDNTIDCTLPGKSYARVVHRDCWKYLPDADSQVQPVVRFKRGDRWRVDPTAKVVVRHDAKACPEEFPHLTRVSLSTAGFKPYQTRHFRLVVPEFTTEIDGEPVVVAQDRINMFACLMREGRDRECP
jgi:hypothetical protein